MPTEYSLKLAPFYTVPGTPSSVFSSIKLLARIIATFKQGHFPDVGHTIVTQDIQVTSGATDFEITVIGIQPAIDHLGYLDQTLTEIKSPWGFLAAVTGIADHPDLEY
jgi:hypothetical protein